VSAKIDVSDVISRMGYCFKGMAEMLIQTVGILIFDDVEVLDFCGPFEVFSTARPAGETGDVAPLFQVVTIAEAERTVHCRGGLLVQPHHTLATHPPLDLLVVPGGQGTRRERSNGRLLDWIVAQDTGTVITASVCTGAFLLAERGLLAERRATTHWASIDWMRQQYPAVQMVDDERVVDTGHIVTSAGVSAGIDMALHLVARFHGQETAAWTARRMEYEWPRTAIPSSPLHLF
jgi:transcriptional regulator GlxA family with amidase domain